MPYVAAFKRQASTSRIPLVGPAYDDSSDVWRDRYLEPFVHGIGVTSLGIITLHEYPTYTCGGNMVTIAQLLAPSLVAGYKREASGWVNVAARFGLPLELGETNSTACGGQDGVDNVFAATAWGLDWLFANAQLGMRRINYHMDDAYYSAVFVRTSRQAGKVVYHDTVAPLYYAMYAFSTAEGGTLLRTEIVSQANITAYSIRDAAGGVRVFVINKDLHAAGRVSIHLSAPRGSGSLLLIEAPRLSSRELSYGRTSFDNETGRLRRAPVRLRITPDGQNNYDFTLDNASIAVITIPD